MEQDALLEKYLQGKLTETEQREFNILLQSDPKFREEVEFQMHVKRAVTAEEDEKFTDMLIDFELEARADESDTSQVVGKKASRFPTKWLVAASIAVLAGLGYFFSTMQTAAPQKLFAESFIPYKNVTHPITRGNKAIDTKTQAFLAYSKEKYNEAIPLFTELYTTQKEPYYLFYKANALIQLNRAAEAIPLLQEHLETQDSLTDKSNWYLAMAYLQLEDTENAKKALRIVVETKAYKAEEAKQLLDEL